MYYKVIKDDKVIDVLDDLIFLKYQKKHNRMVFCDESEAQAIFSSDRTKVWHEKSLYDIPVGGYDIVEAQRIDEYEYERLKALYCGSMEDIIDYCVHHFLNNDMVVFIESLKRLYDKQTVNKSKIVDLYNNGKITIDERRYILGE